MNQLKQGINLEEGNRMIADFMELQKAYQDVRIWMDWDNETIPKWDKRDYWLDRELKYHTSWDWLIPVCKKALDITQTQSRPNVNACNNLDWLECEIGTHIREYNIEATYAAVLAFITAVRNNSERLGEIKK